MFSAKQTEKRGLDANLHMKIYLFAEDIDGPCAQYEPSLKNRSPKH